MKVLFINGSPNSKGCTFTALSEVAGALQKNGIETEIVSLGKTAVQGCIGCGYCTQHDGCVFKDDLVNEIIAKLDTYDGIVLGSPVYYASASGQLASFADRLFYAGAGKFKGKVGAAIVSARRAGTSASLDQLNKYFSISGMPTASATYWNQVHGNTPEEVQQDLEGMQNLRILGQNMAWLLKCIDLGKQSGITYPELTEEKARTNFVR